MSVCLTECMSISGMHESAYTYACIFVLSKTCMRVCMLYIYMYINTNGYA